MNSFWSFKKYSALLIVVLELAICEIILVCTSYCKVNDCNDFWICKIPQGQGIDHQAILNKQQINPQLMFAYCHMSQETILVQWHIKIYVCLPRRYCNNLLKLRPSEKKTKMYMIMSFDPYFIFVVLSYFLLFSGIFGYLNCLIC